MAAKETLVRKRVISTLATNEVLGGADMAGALNLTEGATVPLLGRWFIVSAALPATGTVDDARAFAHLHAVQQLAGKGAGSPVVLRMFLLKAVWLGLAGGVGGYVLGTALAVILGPRVAGVPVLRMLTPLFWAVGVAVVICAAASYWPAWLQPPACPARKYSSRRRNMISARSRAAQ